ncbi:vegetative incompatibility protein HET-E-1 [Echria macrotheca]|uniref:Vegetative incompatibility protein HET-E-1 n=1 Tax=Echria macrotheca TaxID=438768 RepID=A0AAJ0BN11_9PEZI|nr:vegetative incompatibility protein HET-E-1 [Echria macrotheca]
MWLINAKTFERREFVGTSIPDYAVLSHTWGVAEVTFDDMALAISESPPRKAGWAKIEGTCRQAVSDKLDWVWVDTCCIDKRSSAELSEAINSMFAWYRRAARCYVYLEDVVLPDDHALEQSKWFTRGWTLQELLAPTQVFFYDQTWTYIGRKISSSTTPSSSKQPPGPAKSPADQRFLARIASITHIPPSVLESPDGFASECTAKKMSWAASRATTRPEDLAYCLMGLFDVNLPILYGEGLRHAFRRLQLEIMAKTTDHSIFAWDYSLPTSDPRTILAETPAAFRHSAGVTVWGFRDYKPAGAFIMTNSGLQASFFLSATRSPTPLALLECGVRDEDGKHRVAIPLEVCQKRKQNSPGLYLRRVDFQYAPAGGGAAGGGGSSLSSSSSGMASRSKLVTWDAEGLKLGPWGTGQGAGPEDVVIMESRHHEHWRALMHHSSVRDQLLFTM